MAFTALTYWNVQNGGNDATSGNGGGFDRTLTGMATDLAGVSGCNTASPVVSSASYNFAAGDVNAWLYVGAGTNWIPGWYQIASVASNQATLTAGVGTATMPPLGLNTAAGCATTATPTGGTWTVDYSRSTTPRITYTDMVIGATTTQYTSVANSPGVNLVGNIIAVSAGTGFTVQRVVITAVAAGVATCDKSLGTTASTGGTGKLGACYATPGLAGANWIGGNVALIKYNATPYTLNSTVGNGTGGRFSAGGGGSNTDMSVFRGYDVVPGDETSNIPTIKWGISPASATIMTFNAGPCRIENVIFDGNRANFAATRGISFVGSQCTIRRVKFMGFSATAIVGSTGSSYIFENLEVTDCATTAAVSLSSGSSYWLRNCSFHDNIVTVINMTTAKVALADCLFYNNTGASTCAIQATGACTITADHVMIGTIGQHGFDLQVAQTQIWLTNCYVQGAGGWGYNIQTAMDTMAMINCGGFNNSSGNFQVANITPSNLIGFITPASDAFTNLSGGDLSINNTAGAGALLRNAASPASYPGTSTSNFEDVGAAQHQASGTSTITSSFAYAG